MTTKMRLIAAVVMVAIAAAWYALLWHPATTKLTVAHAALASAEQDRVTAAAQLAVVRQKAAQLPAEEARAAALTTAVPTSPNLVTIINDVNGIAAAAGVSWQSESQSIGQATAASPTPAGPGPQPLTLSLSVNGTNQQLLSFVHLLTTAPRVMQVNNLDVTFPTAGTASATQTTSVVATLYTDSTPLPKAPKIHVAGASS